MKKLNLGCGPDIRKGYVNMDLVKLQGVDVFWDLNKSPWPFKDDTFDEVYCSHVLEHVDDLIKVMKEIKRVSKHGAVVVIRVPHFSCGVSYRDPTHKSFFSYFTFDYFTDKCFYNDMPKFNVQEKKLNFTRLSFTFLNYIFNPLINVNPGMYERFFCWILPCSEALFKLRVIKDEKNKA